jgi:SOS-response transcriptional repressor LexA
MMSGTDDLPLTPRQRRVMLLIQAREHEGQRPPSYAEIGASLGVSAVAAFKLVHKLCGLEYLTRTPDRHRTIKVLRRVA